MKKNAFVYLVMPVFVGEDNQEKEKKEEQRRVDDIHSWKSDFKEKVNDILGHKFHIDITTPRIRDPKMYCETIQSEYKNITKKGRMVRHELQRIGSLKKYSDIDNSYFVLIDGSGKINFDSVYNVLKGLEQKQVIFGCRPISRGIEDARVKMEHFENFLLEEKYKATLPDAQCGCWGFNLGVLKDMPLTAESYDIELDVIINALERRLDIGFIQVTMKNVGSKKKKETNFKFHANFEKLDFLSYRLELTRDILNLQYRNFIRKTGMELPKNYIRYFNKLFFSTIRYRKFDCIGSCVKKCEKSNKKTF